MTDTQKKTNVTVPVELIHQAIIMRQRQKKYFSSRDSALIPLCKQAEADFDKMLVVIIKEILAMSTLAQDASQDALL